VQFVNRAYMAQETVAEFIWRTHSQRLEIFAGILNLGAVDSWTQSARDWRREMEKELTVGQGKISVYATQLERLRAAVLPKATILKYRQEVKACSNKIDALQAQVDEKQKSLRQISSLVDLKVKIATLTKEAEELSARQEVIQQLNKQSQVCSAEKLSEIEEQLKDLITRHRESWSDHAQAKKRLEIIQRLGNKCDSCEQPISKKTHEALVKKWELAMTDAEVKEQTLSEAKVRAQADYDKNKKEWEAVTTRSQETALILGKWQVNVSQLGTARKQMSDVRQVLGEAADYPEKLNDEITKLFQDKSTVMSAKMQKEMALREALAAIQQYENLQAEHAKQEQVNAVLAQRITQLKKVESLLGDKGFKAYKINSSRTTFNNSLNKYLSVLSDGDIEAELVTEVPKADGKGTKSELDILVRDGIKSKVPIKQYCVSPDQRVLTADLRWIPAGNLSAGDELIGFDEEIKGQGKGRGAIFQSSFVQEVGRAYLPSFRVETNRGSVVVSSDHKFILCKKGRCWVSAKDLLVGDELAFYHEAWSEDFSFEGGCLKGFFEGEAWISGQAVAFGQNDGETCEWVKEMLRLKGYLVNRGSRWSAKGGSYGVYPHVRFLGAIRPPRLLHKSRTLWEGRRTWGSKSETARINSVTYVGEIEVVTLSTSTKTFIVEGFLSHNSGGEKAAISLAITGAFWDLASQQSNGAVNVLLLDEPFGGADAYGEEKACRLFESMREAGRVIFVVTNRQGVRERGKFDRELRAVKENHFSRIEEYDLSGEH